MVEELPLIDTLPVGVCMVDRNFRTQFWYRSLVHGTGLSKDQTLGSTLTELFPALSQRRYLLRFEQVLETGLPAIFSSQLHKALLPCRRLGGLLRDQQTTVTRARLGEGYGLVFAVEDVSDLSDIIRRNRSFQKKLESQREYLKIFASAAAHDLQAPLRHISGFSNILQETLSGRMCEESAMCLDMISRSVQSLQSMISDLLSHAKAGASTELGTVDLNPVLDSALLNLGLTRHNPQIEVNQLPIVRGNRPALTQVFQNLVGNALKYRSQRAPKVRIEAAQEDSETLISVSDNGIGIPADDLQRIFLPFHRLTGDDQVPGTGLGLSTCRQVVEMHGGRIWAESSYGKGSTFWLSLPKAG